MPVMLQEPLITGELQREGSKCSGKMMKLFHEPA
jgi:hypothetical protein